MKLLSACALFLLLASALLPAGASPNAKLEPPNLSVNVYQRVFPQGKEVRLSVTTYNLHAVTLSAYRTDIETLVPNTTVLDAANDHPANPKSVKGRLHRMNLAHPVARWSVAVKDFYPNQWRYPTVSVPTLSPGVYVIEASGGGVVKRTWLAVSSLAMITKRSPDVVTVWLVSVDGKRPSARTPLALYGPAGHIATATTDANGLATFTASLQAGPLWVAARAGGPAFARAPAPEPEKPYRVYLYTDRPIYRPGQVVHFRGTVRARSRGTYRLASEKTAHVQIKTRGDAVVYDEHLPLNEWGTFAGDFLLAPEPPLGQYSLEVALPNGYREYASFAVESYRRPEFNVSVAMPAPSRLNGENLPVRISAAYLFGSPVSGGKVSYTVSFCQTGSAVPARIFTAAGLGSAAIGSIEDDFSGQGRLDANGTLTVHIPTRRLPYNREVKVRATVTDLAQRSRAGQASMLLTAAQFRLDLRTDQYRYRPNAPVQATLQARDYHDTPVATQARIVMTERRTDREGRTVEERTERTVTTDKDGRATVTFTTLRPGYYHLEAWAIDAEKNPVYADTSFEATTETLFPGAPLLRLNVKEREYAPGDTAHLRIRHNLTNHWALLTIEGERLYLTRPIKLTGKEMTVDVPVRPDYTPGVSIRLATLWEGQMQVEYASLAVPAAEKRLTVSLTPDKPGYHPGETATFAVHTADAAGRGVPAEVGLSVVDTAIYALRRESAAHPYAVFWPPQPNRIETDFSLSATYPGGAFQHIPANSTPRIEKQTLATEAIRKKFEDTAYWTASVATDAQGHGTVAFPLPDNLTTWRATARGLTKGTHAGEIRQEITATQPLMIRLILPRFYIAGDRASAAALVHNSTGTVREVRVALTTDGVQIDGAAEHVLTVPANGITRVTWPVIATGEAARFLVSADGGDGARDAMESTVPVHPNGVRRVETAAGMTAERADVTMTVPTTAVPGSAQVELTLSPSLAGPVLEALEYLVSYPYGCTEQTMDAFLPDVIVTRTFRGLGIDRPEPPMLRRQVNFGVQKLLRFQHGDGGWHWWEHDESDPYMTAYVVYGLAMARDAGYPLAAGPLPRGVGYLEERLQYENDRASATYLLWALASADLWDRDGLLQAVRKAKALYADREKLDTFSQASLALALYRLRGKSPATVDFAAMAQKVARELVAAAVPVGTGIYWTAHASGSGSWLDSNVEVTAQVLNALLAISPESEKIVPTVRWLMAARRGKQWTSTKDTAAAVLALTAYLKQARELAPDSTVAVRIGDRTVQTISFTPQQAFAAPVRIVLPADPGSNTLRLEKTGTGNLYWTAYLSYTVPVETTQPLADGLSLTRTYRLVTEDPVQAGEQHPGDMMEVTIEIQAEKPSRYVMLNAPLPAGSEVIAGEDDGGCYDRRDIWDKRLVYFFDYLPAGITTVSYWIRPEAAGTFHIPPATAELVYFPEVRGESKHARMKVVE